ncbi:MAG: hypothetical protein K9G39_07305 [Chlorobium sp.]|uniref:hypothetical protein n=1 Tax=Chlorobium sp. TaxID=1095 RepID=UPI0025B8C1AA|nr:hypothetical protein [Chlorobium sp.]MCF8383383.1 hypothetical protein [Chlorobium sp.]
MKLFGDPEFRKRFMKSGLPVILAVAWAPIIWMAFTALLGPLLFRITSSFLVVQTIVLPLTLLSLFLFLRAFRVISSRFYGEKA